MLRRITKRDKGRQCAFHGFDGKLYVATVDSVRSGFIVLSYKVKGEEITAYVEPKHANRIEFFDGAHTNMCGQGA